MQEISPSRSRSLRPTFLPFSPPSISEEEIAAVVDTLHSDWITTGPKTNQFEQAFAKYIGLQNALALNSCTGGLHIALAALGIGPGDEVITTPMTFICSANVIEHVGAKPVLADIEPDTLNINPARVAEKLTPQTKAIMPVHFAGHPADMRPLRELAQQHHLFIIDDAAHALSASYEGQAIGTLGDFTAFSFYATKNITTGEGGMLTGTPERLQDARLWSLHGMDRDAWKRYSDEGSWYYEVVVPGFKYNMTDIQAALGLVQLSRLENFQARRRQIVAQYNAAFSMLDTVEIPTQRSNVEHAWQLYTMRLNLEMLTINRAQFLEELTAYNIGNSVHFIPVHLHPYYRHRYGWQPNDYVVAYQEYQRIVSLPLYPRMTDIDVADVIGAITNITVRFKR